MKKIFKTIFTIWKVICVYVYIILSIPYLFIRGGMVGVKYAERYPEKSEERFLRFKSRYAQYFMYRVMKIFDL